MLAAKRVKGFRGFAVGLVFAGAWGAAAAFAIHQFSPVKLAPEWLRVVEIGGIVGGGLFLIHQPPLTRMFLALRRKAAWSNILFWPLLVAYHVLAFPGVLVARVAGLVAFNRDAAGELAKKRAEKREKGEPDQSGACPWEGRVVAEYPVEFHGGQWSPEETIFEIHEDWRVSSEHLRFWGWVDHEGSVREGAGAGEDDAGRQTPVLATLRGESCWIGAKKIGTFRKG